MQTVAFKSSSFAPHPNASADVEPFDEVVCTDRAGVRMPFDRDEEIFGEGEPARYVYQVLSGAVRTCRILSDGRRQIFEIHLAGDVFGLEGETRHALSAEAIGRTTLQAMPRSSFMDGRAEGAPTAMSALLKQCQHGQAHMLLLGRHTACERVAAFLLDCQRRAKGPAIELPVSRQDIADYLGLTIETVSRTFTQLQASQLIDMVSSRRIVLRNVAALEQICE